LRKAQPKVGFYFAVVFFFFNEICQPNNLNVYQTDLHQNCTVGRTTAVDERPEVILSIPQKTLPWQPILWAKSRPNPDNFGVRDIR